MVSKLPEAVENISFASTRASGDSPAVGTGNTCSQCLSCTDHEIGHMILWSLISY